MIICINIFDLSHGYHVIFISDIFMSIVTHCSLLPIICNCFPIDITLEKRLLKFIWNCFNNLNTIVQIIVNISMKSHKSVLGIKFCYLAFKYTISTIIGMKTGNILNVVFLLMLRQREVIVIISR